VIEPDLRASSGVVVHQARAYTVLLVFGAVTLAWWGFLAWLIWRVMIYFTSRK
jgi:hypothetical protein